MLFRRTSGGISEFDRTLCNHNLTPTLNNPMPIFNKKKKEKRKKRHLLMRLFLLFYFIERQKLYCLLFIIYILTIPSPFNPLPNIPF